MAFQSGSGLGIELRDLGIQPFDGSLQLRGHSAPLFANQEDDY
jgi:hypothetical protein